MRAKRPVVLTLEEVGAMLRGLDGAPRLMACLLYGAGVRVLECCQLRVQDIDFATNQIVVRGSKGDKHRVTMPAWAGVCSIQIMNACWAKMVSETTGAPWGIVIQILPYLGPISLQVLPDAVMTPGSTGTVLFRAWPMRGTALSSYTLAGAPNVNGTGLNSITFQPTTGQVETFRFTYSYSGPAQDFTYVSPLDGSLCAARQIVISAGGSSVTSACDPSNCLPNERFQVVPKWYDADPKNQMINQINAAMDVAAALAAEAAGIIDDRLKAFVEERAQSFAKSARRAFEAVKDPGDMVNWNVLATLGLVVPATHLTSGFTQPHLDALNAWADAEAVLMPYLELWGVSLDRASEAKQVAGHDPDADYWFGQQVATAQGAANQAADIITNQLLPAMAAVEQTVTGNATIAMPAGTLGLDAARAFLTTVPGTTYREADNAMLGALTMPYGARTWPTDFVDATARAGWASLASALSATICPGGVPSCQ